MGWPDLDAELCGLLVGHFGVDITGALTRLPTRDLRMVLPLFVVGRFGGGYDGLALDDANVDLDAYGASQEGALALAGRAVVYLTGLRNHTFDGHVITRITVTTSPMRRPYDSKNQVHRYGVTLRVLTHVRSGA